MNELQTSISSLSEHALRQCSRPSALSSSDGVTTVTTFRGEPATKKQIVEQVARLAKAFTNPTKDFYRILMERIAAHGMTQRQLTEAVDRTIDTCKYPTFSVADIVGYDVRYRVYTYAEMLTEMSRTGMMQRDFAILFIEGREKAVWVTFADKVKYNIPDTIKL